MISLLVLIKRKAGMSKQQFREYYETHHVALAKKYAAHLFADYRRNYATSTIFLAKFYEGASDSQDEPFDMVTTILFENQSKCDEFFRVMETPEIKQAFAADEANFMDRAGSLVMLCDSVKTV